MFGFFEFLFPLMFIAVFGLAIGVFASSFAKAAKQKKKDDAAPRLTAEATVVSKRTHVWGDHSRTEYYPTFQFESGDRLELEIPREQIGYLVEGDNGKLHFQGTRFRNFERQC